MLKPSIELRVQLLFLFKHLYYPHARGGCRTAGIIAA
jgi:hypothetical protein